MLSSIFHKSRSVLFGSLAAVALVTSAQSQSQTADVALRARISEFSSVLNTVPGPDGTAADLIRAAGLAELISLPEAQSRPVFDPFVRSQSIQDRRSLVEVQVLNMRLALGMLSQSFGARNNQAVRQAQRNGSTDALVLSKGTATLEDLRLFMVNYGLQEDDSGRAFIVRAPIVLLSGATLVLSPGEVMSLSRPDGAFLMNFGTLKMNGATIRSVGQENLGTPSFAPFVVTGLQGAAQVEGSRFSGLGFGLTDKYSGFSVLRSALLPVESTSFIRDSYFENLESVSINSLNEIDISGNRFHNMRNAALVIDRSLGAKVHGNLFSGTMPTNAIRVIRASNRSDIRSNVILGGMNAGIAVRSRSHGVQIQNNIIWKRDGGGILVKEANCSAISANIVMDNGQKGIEVRTSDETEVVGNLIYGNNSAGIWVSAQETNVNTLLRNNVMGANGSGIGTASAERITLVNNDFTKQFPKFLSGDIARQNSHLARNLKSDAPMTLSIRGPLPFIQQPALSCTY